MWAGVRKVASGENRSIFYHACAKFVTRFASKINCQVCHQMEQVWREQKIATTLICYARLTQCFKPVKNRKKPVSICPDFWTDLNGCQQRLLFAWQLTQRKCSLCSQGISYQTLVKEFCIVNQQFSDLFNAKLTPWNTYLNVAISGRCYREQCLIP